VPGEAGREHWGLVRRKSPSLAIIPARRGRFRVRRQSPGAPGIYPDCMRAPRFAQENPEEHLHDEHSSRLSLPDQCNICID
jgi:hypothetical protein